jgi:hypothetical protein
MSPAIEIRGGDSLGQRFAALGALKGLEPALRAEAEAVAEAARQNLRARNPRSRLAQSIEIMELGTADQPAFAVGTDDPAGFFLEFGTARSRALPWLVPALHARLPSINQAVRKVIMAALKAPAKV